ncbi:MAG TPA: zf-HC2 domain-containing protein [Gemmatimonadales bacterium]|jgi:hypothetical protein
MSADLVTCERVDESDLDTRYLAGTLSEEEASAFEEHYFGCDRCWALVQQGIAARAGLVSEAKAKRTRPRVRAWWGLAAAAAIAAIGIGLWRWTIPPAGQSAVTAVRGRGTLVLQPSATSAGAAVAWSPVSDADVYRVRLYSSDGTLLKEREVSDTSLNVPLDSIPHLSPGAKAYWDVEALNRVREPVGRSQLAEAVLSPTSP